MTLADLAELVHVPVAVLTLAGVLYGLWLLRGLGDRVLGHERVLLESGVATTVPGPDGKLLLVAERRHAHSNGKD